MNLKHALVGAVAGFGLLAMPQTSWATIVEFDTNMGKFQVNLYDETTPATVENFLKYVNDGRYTNNVIHRSVPGFVIQGGGLTYEFSTTLGSVEAYPTVNNEPKLANKRGTISMAKIGGQPNSATSQFFFNLVDNEVLDYTESGYTVFGKVTTDEGMAVVDAIAALNVFNLGSSLLSEVPLQNYTAADLGNVTPDENHLVLIHSVTVTDAATDTAAGTNPVANSYYDEATGSAQLPPATPNNPDNSSSDSGGGSLGWGALALLAFAGFGRRKSRV